MKTILLKIFPCDIAEYIYNIVINEYIERNIIGKVYLIELYFNKINEIYNYNNSYNLLYEVQYFMNIYNIYKFIYSKKAIYQFDDFIKKNINNSCIKLLYHLDYQNDLHGKNNY